MATKEPGHRSPSLRHAELRLVLFLEDLERAVANADQLASAGLEEDAIKIIDLQRDALEHLPEQLAADLAPPKRRLSRRLAVGTAAAALTLVAMVASAMGLIGEDAPTPEGVARKISAAEGLGDPSERLDTLEEAIVQIAALDADVATVRALSNRAERAARSFEDEARENSDTTLEERATKLAQLARSQAPAPAESGSPIDGLIEDL